MAQMSGLWEGIVLSLLFVVLLTSVLAHFNTQYDQDYDVGLDTSGMAAFQAATDAAYSETGGEVTQTSEGLTLASSWNMGKGILSTLWNFVNGSWIPALMSILGMGGAAGIAIGNVLRLLYLGALIFAVIKLFFKVAA
jgi:hypothetical protein